MIDNRDPSHFARMVLAGASIRFDPYPRRSVVRHDFAALRALLIGMVVVGGLWLAGVHLVLRA